MAIARAMNPMDGSLLHKPGVDSLPTHCLDGDTEAIIPPKKNRNVLRNFDRDAYRGRHRIEKIFSKIKEFGASATRYDKTASGFAAGIHLATGVIAARWISTGP
ncbi:MAG: hypothetical protein OXC62_10625 [Aestuariivita sp.]|nr:hypothetical protein [Aestuariivita sp.]